ncbi:hypothetical protein [Nocardiopsis synnemataformans]|uniref:hypothetical protein n=1 Tax=Nocardiopsis synnemataformans TaxID=61305 RepID=UPI003EB6A544
MSTTSENTTEATEAEEFLGRDAILTADDRLYDVVPVPEWNGKVRIRSLTGTERDRFEADVAGNGKKLKLDNVRAKFVARSIVDAKGNQVFSNSGADIAALGKKNAAALNRVFEACQKLSGLTDEDVDELLGE